MANIQTTMSLTDRVTGTLNKIYATMERVKNAGPGIDKVMKAQESAIKKAGDSGQYFVNKAGRLIDINGRFVNSAMLAAAGLKKEELALRDLGNASNHASNKLSKLGSLKGLLKTALASIAVGAITKQAIGMSDEYANMHARYDSRQYADDRGTAKVYLYIRTAYRFGLYNHGERCR